VNGFVLTIVCIALIACTACGDDDDSTPDSGTTAGTGGGGGGSGGGAEDGGKDSGGEDDAGFSSVSCDVLGRGACQNTRDCPIVESGEARGSASTCGISCLGDDDETDCAKTCVADETGLTTDCAECYVGIVSCSRENCLARCASDPESSACFECQVDKGCRATFDDCSGLPPPQ
jgi:hypothetical protein